MRHTKLTYTDGSEGGYIPESAGPQLYPLQVLNGTQVIDTPRHQLKPGNHVIIDACDPEDEHLNQIAVVKSVEVVCY